MVRNIRFYGGMACLVAGVLLAAFASPAVRLAAQNVQPTKKVRVEEEEESEKSKVPKKIDEIEPKGTTAQRPPSTGKFNIAKEAAQSKNLVVRAFLQRISIPFDILVPAKGASSRIALQPERTLPAGPFTYFELNSNLRTGRKVEMPSSAGLSLQPYEEMVLEEVLKVLDPTTAKRLEGVKRSDLIELCVQVLQSTRQWHVSQIEQKVRVGKGWQELDDKLRKQIIHLRRDQLKAAVDLKDWKKADELSLELSNFDDDPEAQKDIYRLLLRKALERLNPERDQDFIALRDAVNQFENLGGGKGEPIADEGRRQLTQRASEYVKQAKKLADDKQTGPGPAFQMLKQAEALNPDLEGIKQLRAQLRGSILYVGVPRLPDRMSPSTARTDPERWAVELMFESLLQSVPDSEIGRRYRPELAASLPALARLGRDFELQRSALWSIDGKTVDARDVFGTLELLQKFPDLACAEGLDVIDAERVRIDDQFHVRMSFRQGVLEPLGRTTFKVLPARYMKAAGKDVDDEQFARKPFGSGPYRYDGREKDGDREAAVFRANPYYSQRAGKFGLPNIQEIRFVVPNLSTVAEDFAKGQMHLVLDVPTGDLQSYLSNPASTRVVEKMLLNRRIYMLAINHRRLKLQNADLRRGLSLAIDRETILNNVYRPGGVQKHHRALTGPYPVDSWATPENARKAPLFNRSLANGLSSSAVGKEPIKLSLVYPEEDRLAIRACTLIKEQVEAATKKTPTEAPLVEIVLTPVAGDQLSRKLEQEQDFDLAYVPYDYKDDLYWLGSLLDATAAGRGGRNFLGYLAPGSNPQPDDNDLRIAIDEIRARRNFKDAQRETWNVHAKFLRRMPFVPLWQLDRHMVVHDKLEMFMETPGDKVSPERLDPATIFPGIENWRFK